MRYFRARKLKFTLSFVDRSRIFGSYNIPKNYSIKTYCTATELF